VVCGRGNNGGDGFVVARLLRRRGRPVSVWLLGDAGDVRGDAAAMLAAWRRGGGRVRALAGREDVAGLASECRRAALVVDALFGTGLNAPLAGPARDVVDAINASGAPTLAVDIASGVSSDTGQVLGAAVRARVTATFGLAKVGQVVFPGAEHTGALEIVDIGLVDEGLLEAGPGIELLEPATVAAWLPRRTRAGHKGTFGHVLVIAGSRGKLGAALLAAHAAGRGGAGLTTLAVPSSLQPAAEGRVAEVMTAAVDDDGTGCGTSGDPERLRALLEGRTAVVCGPGLGLGDGPRALVAALIELTPVPLVLDADGLNAVAGTALLRARPAPTIVTPHPGEMARLLGGTVPDVQADRIGVARRFAAAERVVVVLKGARTVIADPAGRTAICPTGNPGLGSGGTGDVLAGLVGSMLAQGLAPFEAATYAVFVHGRAADRIAADRGEVGLLARDVLAEVPPTIAELQRSGPP
jgi:NAD(P)H-hydrate epimerase